MNPTDKPKRPPFRRRWKGNPKNVWSRSTLAGAIEKLRKAEAKKADNPSLPFPEL